MTYSFNNTKILLVEDNAPMLQLIKAVLLSFGVGRVITALDGEEAFTKFCNTNPDLVISDWMMHPCDGIELSNRIRNDSRSPNQYVPIILMTGFSEKKRVINARDSGITEFLVKPFNTRDLYKRLHKIIEQPRQFIRCEHFFGPDRRRGGSTNEDGLQRRHNDSGQKTMPNDTITNIDLV